VQTNERAVKASLLRRLAAHARASLVTAAAGTLLLWQTPVPALRALALWTGADDQVAKLDAWRAWRGYAVLRMRFKVLAGVRHAMPAVLSLRRAWGAWRAASASKARERLQSVEAEGDADLEGGVAAWRHVPALPPLWREPISRVAVMEAVAEEAWLPQKLLRRKVLAVSTIKVCS
jgi:hypothetical protein